MNPRVHHPRTLWGGPPSQYQARRPRTSPEVGRVEAGPDLSPHGWHWCRGVSRPCTSPHVTLSPCRQLSQGGARFPRPHFPGEKAELQTAPRKPKVTQLAGAELGSEAGVSTPGAALLPGPPPALLGGLLTLHHQLLGPQLRVQVPRGACWHQPPASPFFSRRWLHPPSTVF